MTQCPVCSIPCNGALFEQVVVRVDGSATVSYDMRCCESCGSQFADPLREAPPEFYDHDVPVWRWEFGEVKRDLHERVRKGSSVLEIGCNEGNCLAHLDHSSYNISGIDLNAPAVERAKRKGFRCSIRTIEEIQKTEIFDMVFFFHVLEHVPDPYRFLKTIRSILSADGFIAFSVPDESRLQLLAGREEFDYPPNHLFRFSCRGITSLLDRAGFKVVRVAHHPRDLNCFRFLSNTVHAMLRSGWCNWLYNREVPRPITMSLKLPFFIIRAPDAAVRYILNRHRPGLAYYVLAQRTL